MYKGSMSGKGTLAFALWGYCIGTHDRDGFVELNAAHLAQVFGDVTPEDIEKQIAIFCKPDKYSRTKTESGKRLQHMKDDTYYMVNYKKYQEMCNLEERRRQNREAQKRYRERHKE
jgi:hypothetical protein